MKFYSGFALKNDIHFFKEYIQSSSYTVCGFSYGAIKALEYTKNELTNGKRIDTLQLFSPAFFQTKQTKYKRLQTMGYKKNEDQYLKSFINTCFEPYSSKTIEYSVNSLNELEELLNHEWIKSDFIELQNRGLKIEVYLGSEDKVIDVKSAKEFFTQLSTVTYIKNANHFLQKD